MEMSLVYYVLICLIFGTTFLGIKLGVEAGGPPLLFAAIRFFGAGVLVLLYLAWKKHAFPRSGRSYWRLFRVGFLTTTIFFGVLYWAEQFIPSNLAALLNATSPVLICLIGAMQHKRPLHLTQTVGLVLGIFGVYLIVSNQGMGSYSAYWTAVLILIGAQVFNAFGTLESRKLFEDGVSAWLVSGFQMMFGSLGLFVASLLKGETLATIHDPWGAVGSLFFLIFIGSIVGWGLYYQLVSTINPLLPSTWCYVAPAVAMVIGAIWLQEPITLLSMIGAVVVLAAVGISNWLDWRTLWQGRKAKKEKVGLNTY
jgi:drug/metabolite transporter (DMT)-like permease